MARVLAIAFGLMLIAVGPLPAASPARSGNAAGAIELDTRSEFSHVRVRRRGSIRTMIFVRDGGVEAVESQVNLRRPHDLLVPYTRTMFASYLFRPEQEEVLIVGLGGGGMVHFLKHHDPKLKIDAVEIDPAVVKIAAEYFGVRSGGHLNVVTADAFRFLDETKKRYDVIYMDAFLKPAPDTDPTGVPLRMKTIEFYKQVQEKLKPDGLVVFNVNVHDRAADDIKTIRGAFAQVYPFRVLDVNVVVVASTAKARETTSALKTRARQLDRRFKANFSFSQLLKQLAR